jgi:CMP-N,N'-diacetyllegionaminic acid synthase
LSAERQILGLIPARGGSQAIPRKNLRLVGDRSLVERAIDSALAATCLARVVVSTDDEELADQARVAGADVPFLRPRELGRHDSPALPVILHALDALEVDGERYDAVAYLQPTSPFRSASHIEQAAAIFGSRNAETVVSVTPVPHRFMPEAVFPVAQGWAEAPPRDPGRRQDQPILFARNGPAVLISRCDILRSGRLYGSRLAVLSMNVIESLDIDEPEDLLIAQALAEHRP